MKMMGISTQNKEKLEKSRDIIPLMTSKTAAILIIGDEVLSGRTQDANTPFLASRLSDMGIEVVEVRTVRDVTGEIVEAVNALRARVDYLFTTGGIGPTHDDITSESIARAFGVPVELNPAARQKLADYYTPRQTELNAARLRMATIPQGARLIDNPVSAAPGFQIGNVYVMAGVPSIMQAMFEGLIAGLDGGPPIQSLAITCRAREGDIAHGLTDIQNRWPDVKIGSYPAFLPGSQASLTLVLRARDPARLAGAAAEIRELVVEAPAK